MKKKLLSLLLTTAMVASFAVGCGSSSATDDNSSSTTDNSVSASEEGKEDEANEEVTQRTVYVTPEWVQSALAGNEAGYENILIANVGYGPVEDCKEYNDGHITGAIYVDNCEVEDAIGDVEHPYNLLDAEEIAEFALARGINKDTKLVLYGSDVSSVARQAYGYIVCGVEDVKIINGGLDAWTKAGGETETTVNEAEALDDFGTEVPAHSEYWISMDDARDRLENDDNFKLVSIRSEEEWLGTTSGYSYMDKAGEPEGAVWGGRGPLDPYDMSGYFREDGTIMNLDEVLASIWKDVDFTMDNHLSFYCGTGWRACIPFLICYEAGYDDISVYDGGWYEWMLHDENPVQVGDPADENCEHTTVADLPNDKAAE